MYTWIYRIALNLCNDRMRSKRELEIYEDIVEGEEMVEDTVFDAIDREILKKELFNLIVPMMAGFLLLFIMIGVPKDLMELNKTTKVVEIGSSQMIIRDERRLSRND